MGLKTGKLGKLLSGKTYKRPGVPAECSDLLQGRQGKNRHDPACALEGQFSTIQLSKLRTKV